MSGAEEPADNDPIPDRSDLVKGLRTVFLDKVAHTGMMIARTNRILHGAERIQKFAATGKIEDLHATTGGGEGEAMNDYSVGIGNEVHYHYQVGADKAAAAPPNTPPIVVTPTTPTKKPPVTPKPTDPIILKPNGNGGNGETTTSPIVLKPDTPTIKPDPLIPVKEEEPEQKDWKNPTVLGAMLLGGLALGGITTHLLQPEDKPDAPPPVVSTPVEGEMRAIIR